ncbi:hypothetical protein CLV36_110116 [Laceyella sediminis]|jgi:hypothetical protein|uniref:Uncharacterized protein n=2 Tax=Laceyella TaxID=292635 RepID=A0AA46AGH1_9BACL|nr:hypothetical protein CLV36_110116 [Laceyella sediminis]SMP28530.1 hypothetical protein SAMN06265361_106109 [Laceyella tengchongensis]
MLYPQKYDKLLLNFSCYIDRGTFDANTKHGGLFGKHL